MVCSTCNANYFLNASNLCYPYCGDGVINNGEVCDNTDYSSHCCASNCLSFNQGYMINAGGIPNATCTSNCCIDPSDGIVASGTEQCDDGNAASGDGCAGNTIESGWSCSLNATGGSVCTRTPANTTTDSNLT